MSTFKGVVAEFPGIRIDYFRKLPDHAPPLACFLSHVHSDHLLGLESFRSPFIYCSAATREILLRLEKYPHRMNFAKGILESRKQHYKHLKNLLKTIPLNTPTEIELSLGRTLRVTLLDANHCVGAVMFLIEGDSKTVLYTGDIRAEPWWVNTLVRNPVMLPYTLEQKRLHKIYLDTTFAVNREPYRSFPTKAEGLGELLAKVSSYPKNTIFHFNAWTFGYEGVWIALAAALGSQIHLDEYKLGLYKALEPKPYDVVTSDEAPALCGFRFGNTHQKGCLTSEKAVRLHSCERGTDCTVLKSSAVVWIRPVLTRDSAGALLPELGAGGGGGDLYQTHELELNDSRATAELVRLCSEKITDSKARSKTLKLISDSLNSERKAIPFDELGINVEEDIRLESVVLLLNQRAQRMNTKSAYTTKPDDTFSRREEMLPRSLHFPYSRHSSYQELCHLVDVFRPIDVYPCTVDEMNWTQSVSMKSLFGHLCVGKTFVHDQEMVAFQEEHTRTLPRKRKLENFDRSHSPQRSSQACPTSDQETDGGSDNTVTRPRTSTPSRQVMSELQGYQALAKRQRTSSHGEEYGSEPSKGSQITSEESTFNSCDWRVQAIQKHFGRSGQRHSTSSIPPVDVDKVQDKGHANVHFTKSHEQSLSQKSLPTPPIEDEAVELARRPTSINSQHTSTHGRPLALSNDSRKSSEETDQLQGHNDGSSGEHEETQVSLADSAFESQQSGQVQGSGSESKIEQRKQVYQAVKKADSREWALFSPMSSGNAHTEEEIELR